MLSYSDFGLHRFALNQGAKFSDFLLDPEHLMDSAKCRALAELLPKLKVLYFFPVQMLEAIFCFYLCSAGHTAHHILAPSVEIS